jgi:hypothetical protein
MKDMKKIRQAFCANRGGWDNESDDAILSVWNSLPLKVQDAYMESVKTKPAPKKEIDDADRDQTGI